MIIEGEEESEVWYELHSLPLPKNHPLHSKYSSSDARGILIRIEDPLKRTSLELSSFQQHDTTKRKEPTSTNNVPNDHSKGGGNVEVLEDGELNKKLKKSKSSRKSRIDEKDKRKVTKRRIRSQSGGIMITVDNKWKDSPHNGESVIGISSGDNLLNEKKRHYSKERSPPIRDRYTRGKDSERNIKWR